LLIAKTNTKGAKATTKERRQNLQHHEKNINTPPIYLARFDSLASATRSLFFVFVFVFLFPPTFLASG
jgi:hypothetical protein